MNVISVVYYVSGMFSRLSVVSQYDWIEGRFMIVDLLLMG